MAKNIYSKAKIGIGLLDAFIIVGLFALALLSVYLSATGGFNISFDALGGSEVNSQKLRYGEAIVEPRPPTREGYAFVGWYEDKSLTKEADFSSLVATSSITFYACWEEIE